MDGNDQLQCIMCAVLALLLKEQVWALACVQESGWTSDIVSLLKHCQGNLRTIEHFSTVPHPSSAISLEDILMVRVGRGFTTV